MGNNRWVLRNVDSTMTMEGMPLDDEDRRRILNCLEGKKSFQQTVDELILHYGNGGEAPRA